MAENMAETLPQYVAGLGNPGKKYEDTRHNVGVRVLNAVETECDTSGSFKKHKGRLTKCWLDEREFWTFRPRTYMNESGRAIQALCAGRRIRPQQVLIVTDCADLPFGKLRLRKKGGSGGHRGVQSVIDCLGTDEFPRLRVGIGREGMSDIVGFVLGHWTAKEEQVLRTNLKTVADTVITAVAYGMDTAMNRYNNLNPFEQERIEEEKEKVN